MNHATRFSVPALGLLAVVTLGACKSDPPAPPPAPPTPAAVESVAAVAPTPVAPTPTPEAAATAAAPAPAESAVAVPADFEPKAAAEINAANYKKELEKIEAEK